ncbi:MAG: uroporphyrinogen-III synthase [Acidobacteriota bacterium]
MSARGDRPAVLVTRPAEDAERWVAALADRGWRAIVYPCLAIEPLDGPELRAALRSALDGAAVLALTSPRAVERVAALLDGAAPPPVTRIAAVGRATADAARSAFGRVDLVPAGETGDALAALLRDDPQLAAGGRVVAPGADRARRALESALAPRGVDVVRLAVYRTVPVAPQAAKDDPERVGAGAALLASPSAVEGLDNRMRDAGRLRLVSIGPTTSAAIRARGWRVAAEASRPGLEEMIDALERACGVTARGDRRARRDMR